MNVTAVSYLLLTNKLSAQRCLISIAVETQPNVTTHT